MCTLYCEWMCVIWILYSGVIRCHNLFLMLNLRNSLLCWSLPGQEVKSWGKMAFHQHLWRKYLMVWPLKTPSQKNLLAPCRTLTKPSPSKIYSWKPLISLVFIGILIQFLIIQGHNTTSRPTSPGSHIIPPAPSEGPPVPGNQAWRSHPPAETVDATSDITSSQSG